MILRSVRSGRHHTHGVSAGPQFSSSASLLLAYLSSSTRQCSHLESSVVARLDSYDARKRVELGLGFCKRTELEGVKKRKMYILPMFPYPSGDLHMGHLRVYTISDVLARFRRMQGYEVIHPIGWDAFGLPAENAAIERGINPAIWTKQNIQRMKTQLKAVDGHWDWEREFATCDSSFYKHTQQLFLLLHQAGLAYQADSLVNYDPVDKTVLANEQVDFNGRSWRSGAKVEKKNLKQWFFRISKFREELLVDLEHLAKNNMWPENVLAMQKNWLGKSNGARIKFPIVLTGKRTSANIEVFTTRPDTLLGVQYVALATTHPIVQTLAKADAHLGAWLASKQTFQPDDVEPHLGYRLSNIHVINPLSSEKDMPDSMTEELPVYVAPYVIGRYGEGAIMGVPGHDARDHAFWSINKPDAPVRRILDPHDSSITKLAPNQLYVNHGRLNLDNGPFSGMTTAEAGTRIVHLLESQGMGTPSETWRLQDWLVSRQRYWGTPIPIIHCGKCGPVGVPESQLPIELPYIENWHGNGSGNPLEAAYEWINVSCPSCGQEAKRETDTMDTFVDSSWYFMRFLDPKNDHELISKKAAKDYLPVDLYIGGVEHAILHLLYARFISKFIASTKLWPEGRRPEIRGAPFKQVITQGMVHGKTYTDPDSGRFLKLEEIDLSQPANPIVLRTGAIANVSFEKMSKSKYNGVDPIACIESHGADSTRAHILFQAPIREVLNWDETKISGVTRWLDRLKTYVEKASGRWNRELGVAFNNHTAKDHFRLNQAIHDSVAVGDLRLVAPVFENMAGRIFNPKEKNDVVKKLGQHQRLWERVQRTIISVTESYGKTFALNTVVSDLMVLTNMIFTTDEMDKTLLQGHLGQPFLLQRSTLALLQMMAPITPSFSDKCWDLIHNHHNPKSKSSIFEVPFPAIDGSLELLKPQTQTCAVQVNGKLKCTANIPIPPLKLTARDLHQWLLKRVLEDNEAARKLERFNIAAAQRIVVAGKGKVVNFVVAGSKPF